MERLLKPSLAFGSLCLLIYMFPQKAFYITVFSSGVILTVIIELIVFYFYLDRESDGFDEVEIPKNTHKINIIPIANEDYSPRPSVLKEKSNFLALSDVLGLERRMSGLPCVCNSPEFAMLCSGGEVTINELIGYMKDLYLVEKSYGNALVKLCDASFLDKFKKKSSDILSKFKETLKSIGKAHLDEAEFLDEALLENLGTVEKEIKHQYKEIVQKLKTSSKDFENTVHNIQKLQTKLINSESNLNRASNDYEDGKKELVPYDVLMKKEMKLKLTKNEVSTLKNTIKQYKDNMESESKVYLPKAVEILDQLKKFKQKRADVYRSNIQS